MRRQHEGPCRSARNTLDASRVYFEDDGGAGTPGEQDEVLRVGKITEWHGVKPDPPRGVDIDPSYTHGLPVLLSDGRVSLDRNEQPERLR